MLIGMKQTMNPVSLGSSAFARNLRGDNSVTTK